MNTPIYDKCYFYLDIRTEEENVAEDSEEEEGTESSMPSFILSLSGVVLPNRHVL